MHRGVGSVMGGPAAAGLSVAQADRCSGTDLGWLSRFDDILNGSIDPALAAVFT